MNIFLFPSLVAASLLMSSASAHAADIKTLIKQKQESRDKAPRTPIDIPYTYVVTADINTGEGDKTENFVAKYHINPKAAPGSRLTFIGNALETFPKDFQTQMERLETETTEAEIAEQFWCSGIDDKPDISPEDFTVIREDEREALVTISNEALKNMISVGSGGDGDMPKKILKRLSSELTLTKPDVRLRHMKVWLTKPTTVKIVAKIKEMNIEQSCEVAPNGIPYITTRKMRVDGKAFGKKFAADTVITVSDLKPL